LLAGCRQDPEERAYGFVHMETTGLTQGIVIHPRSLGPGGRPKNPPDVIIVFSDSSDHDARRALDNLDEELLLPNANGDGIVIVGALDPVVHQTTSGPGKPTSEPYQEFRLSRWYLRAPFARVRFHGLDDPSAVELVDRLQPKDFRVPIAGDLARFIRR
jgi:hypothetical protein